MPAKNTKQAKAVRVATLPRPKAVEKIDPWHLLQQLIAAYVEAAIAESWKGGGDPMDYEVLELREKLTRVELANHIDKMRRDIEGLPQ